MKVICIDATNQRNDGYPNVVEGDVYTVDRECYMGEGYVLKELNNPLGYYKKRFMSCSEIDEMEFVEAYNNRVAV